MKYNPNIHHRKSIRLKEYDYSQNGYYFITMCTQNREDLFGEIVDGRMVLNRAGEIIKKEWEKLPDRFSNIELDVFVVMPNHYHGIIIINNDNNTNVVGVPLVGTQKNTQIQSPQMTGQPQGIAPTSKYNNIGNIVGAFKSLTTNKYIDGVKSGIFSPFEKRIWQRNYYEHIIRNEKSFKIIREYILNNPQKWENDKFFIS